MGEAAQDSRRESSLLSEASTFWTEATCARMRCVRLVASLTISSANFLGTAMRLGFLAFFGDDPAALAGGELVFLVTTISFLCTDMHKKGWPLGETTVVCGENSGP